MLSTTLVSNQIVFQLDIQSHYFWILGVYIQRPTVFLGIPIWNPFWRFLLRTTCHSTVHNCMTIAAWRVWNNKHLKPAHYSGDIVSSQGKPQLFIVIQLCPLLTHRKCITLTQIHIEGTVCIPSPVGCERKALCVECLVPADEMSGMKPHLLSFWPQIDYCGLINAGTQNDSMFMCRFLCD